MVLAETNNNKTFTDRVVWIMFEKNLHDLVRGIRTNKEDEGKYIASCIDEIRNELKQDNMSLKALGAAKLTYLQMLGYDISWASFNLIEVISCLNK